jgi:hypothetical protein
VLRLNVEERAVMRFAGVLSVLVAMFATAALAEDAKTKVLFIAGRPSHGPGEHEHRAGCMSQRS